MLRIDTLNFSRRQIESFALKILRSNEAISSPGHSSLSSCHPCRQFSSSYHHQQHHGNHNHHHRRRQQRSTPHNRLRISKNNPYDVLGIPRDSCADTVKRKFLQLALRHHPDTNQNDNQKSTTETFVKIREAFERIKQDFASREDVKSSSWLTEEEFDAWFHEETGQKMDAATRREVMHVYRSGLTRTEYGAVWEIAFILEEEGFFTHKERTLPKHDDKTRETCDSGENDNAHVDNTKSKSQPRRKRSF